MKYRKDLKVVICCLLFALWIVVSDTLFVKLDFYSFLGTICAYYIRYAPILIVSMIFFKKDVKKWLRLQNRKSVIGLLVVYFGYTIIVNLLYGYPDGIMAPIVYAIMLLCTVGVFEELLFRGIVYHDFKKRHSEGFAIIMSTLMFVCMHVSVILTGDIGSIVLFAVLASMLSLSFIYLNKNTGNLWVSIICHALWDMNISVGLVVIFLLVMFYVIKDCIEYAKFEKQASV